MMMPTARTRVRLTANLYNKSSSSNDTRQSECVAFHKGQISQLRRNNNKKTQTVNATKKKKQKQKQNNNNNIIILIRWTPHVDEKN